MLWHPVADRREPRPERRGHDVLGIADEDRGVAQPRIAFDVRDVLGVVVARQPGLRFVDRQPADEVGEERVGRGLQTRILMQEEVDLPRLVPEPEVIGSLAHDVVEQHEVRDKYLVELTPRLERVQLVLTCMRLECGRLARKVLRCRVNPLACRLEHGGDGMLGEPVDLEFRPQLAQLRDDGEITLRVAEPDRARHDEHAGGPPGAHTAIHTASPSRSLGEELVDQQVDRDRVAGLRAVPGPGERDERAPRRVGQPPPSLLRDHGVLVAVNDEHRARHPRAELEHRLPVGNALAVLGGDDRLAGRVEPPPHAILDLLR